MTEEQPISPDELFFELYDWLPLAFERPVSEAELAFGPTDDGAQICLIDLTGTAPAAAPPRPELGYADDEVLDTLNALIGALGHMFGERIRFAPQRGKLVLRPPDGDGAQAFWWVDADDVVRVKRRIDQSEQEVFFHTPALFAALNQTAEAEQQLLPLSLHEKSDRYALDVAAGRIEFLAQEAPVATFRATVLATHHEESRNFIWGWGNEALPEDQRERGARVKKGAGRGLRALTAAELFCPPTMAQRLCGHAAVKLGAQHLFKARVDGPEAMISVYLALDALEQ